MRGANCWSDHQMVRAKLCLSFPLSCQKKKGQPFPFAAHALRYPAIVEDYQLQLAHCLHETVPDQRTTSEQSWSRLKSCISTAAEKSIGRARRKQPDWFLESVDKLMPLIKKKEAHNRMLQSNSIASCKEFRKRQRLVQTAVKLPKKNGFVEQQVKEKRLLKTVVLDGKVYKNYRWQREDVNQINQVQS